MNEKEIQSFSLETLLTVNEPRPEDLYFDGCLIASRVKIMDTVNIDLFRYPTRLDAFAILFCSEGSISFTSGLRRHTLDAKMLFVLLPGLILQVESIRPESSVYTVICEEEFIRRINIDIKLLSRLFLSVEKQPCLLLCEAEWAGITGSFAEIRSESLPRPGDVYSPEILRSMIRTLAYKVCRIIGRHIESQPAPETSARSRNDEYFNQFMSELTKHYMQERSVGFYAGQLHLTPKYLTTIIRKTSGRTAEIFDDEYSGDRLLPQFPQPVVFRQVFPQPHGHDPVGIPDEQIAGGFAAVRLFRIFGVVTTLSEGRQVPPSRTAVRYCSDPTFSYLCK